MLILQTGNCEKCQKPFGQWDTVQSTEVTCKKCGKEYKICSECKSKDCTCGGKLLDAWDQFGPDVLH